MKLRNSDWQMTFKDHKLIYLVKSSAHKNKSSDDQDETKQGTEDTEHKEGGDLAVGCPPEWEETNDTGDEEENSKKHTLACCGEGLIVSLVVGLE